MSMHPMTNHHVPGIWTHLGETLHIWRHHLGETLHIWRQRYQDRQELADGPTGTCTTLASRGATSPAKSKNPSGGLNQAAERRRCLGATP